MGQMGGGMGGMGGGMGGMGGGMMQNQMGMMQDEMGMMQNQMGGNEVRRAARVELEGGRHLDCQIDLRNVMVNTDLGHYTLMPEKIKVIRFIKPANEAPAAPKEGEDNANPQGTRAARGGIRDANNQIYPTDPSEGRHGRRQRSAGSSRSRRVFRLELGFGTLVPIDREAADHHVHRWRSQGRTGQAGEAGRRPRCPKTPCPADRPIARPGYFRQGRCVIVVSPVGDKVSLYNFDSKQYQCVGAFRHEGRPAPGHAHRRGSTSLRWA